MSAPRPASDITPLTEAEHAAVAVATAAAAAASDGRLVVLLVDDDPDCRALMREALQDAPVPHKAVELGDGQALLDYLAGNLVGPGRPSLVFLDVEMPRLGGLDALARLRSIQQWDDLPVVMMTGVAQDDTMRAAAELGANSYTIKPADFDQFLRTVLTSASYWLTVHQYPGHHLPQAKSRR